MMRRRSLGLQRAPIILRLREFTTVLASSGVENSCDAKDGSEISHRSTSLDVLAQKWRKDSRRPRSSSVTSCADVPRSHSGGREGADRAQDPARTTNAVPAGLPEGSVTM